MWLTTRLLFAVSLTTTVALLTSPVTTSRRHGGRLSEKKRGLVLFATPADEVSATPAEEKQRTEETLLVLSATPADEKHNVTRRWDTVAAEIVERPDLELASNFLVLVACGAYVTSTVPTLSTSDLAALEAVEDVLSTVFAIEYAARWSATNFSLPYTALPLSIVDLMSFGPYLIERVFDLSGSLSFLGLIRILRFQRLLVDVETFTRFKRQLTGETFEVRTQMSRTERLRNETLLQLARVFSALFTLLFIASGFIYNAEHLYNPAMPDFATSFYFGLTTLTTVGFGDIVPVTTNGRIVVSASILIGIAVIPVQLTQLAESLLARQRELDIIQNRNVARSTRLDRLSRSCATCSERAHRRDAAHCFRCGTALQSGGGLNPPAISSSPSSLVSPEKQQRKDAMLPSTLRRTTLSSNLSYQVPPASPDDD